HAPERAAPSGTDRCVEVVERLAAQSERPRLLIVDDTVTNRRLLQAILKRRDYEILEAEDGEEALRVVRESLPDLILLDIMMPKKDGYEVCTELHRDPRTAEIPVIFLSAKTQAEDKVRGLELGAVDYITKPYDRAEILARVETHLKLRALSRSMTLANQELRVRQERIEADLRAASVIQRSLLPPDDLRHRYPQLDIAWQFLPCDSIGGDIFNVVRLDEHRLGLYMLDVSGHGVPSAMVTVSVSQQLYPQAGILKEISDVPNAYRVAKPSEVLAKLDGHFPIERFGKYFTMCYAILDVRTGALVSARAAHPPSYLIRRSGELERIQPVGTIVGLGGIVPFEDDERQLEPGDRLFLYTDGIVEHPNPAGQRFGDERLERVLSGSAGGDLDSLCDAVREAVDAFGEGLPPEDDITFMALEYRGPDGARR
ncbi:SpoIIE family protein phosphatase, partial [bacterium]|nr:SpoIIE family protein phosphatase [bacterium]